MAIEVTRVGTEAERALARGIRHAVFVVEQGVPVDVEVDGLDPQCDQFLVWVDGVPAATARARATQNGWKLERVAVLAPHRRRALGRALVQAMLDAAPPDALVYVHAQESALGFWERAGFVASGPAFVEGGISHRRMRFERRASGR